MRKFASALPSQLSSLKRAAGRYVDSHSCASDVRLALEFVGQAIRWHRTGRRSLHYAKIALMQAAVSHYARAFDKRTGHRRAITLGPDLGDDVRKFHDQLITLRHEALSHFGPAGTGQPWSEDFHLLILDEGIWHPAVASKRAGYQSEFVVQFQEHARTVESVLAGKVKQQGEIFHALLNDDIGSISDPEALIASCRVEPADFGGWDGPILGGQREGSVIIEMDDISRG